MMFELLLLVKFIIFELLPLVIIMMFALLLLVKYDVRTITTGKKYFLLTTMHCVSWSCRVFRLAACLLTYTIMFMFPYVLSSLVNLYKNIIIL